MRGQAADPLADLVGEVSRHAPALEAPTVVRHGDEFIVRWDALGVELTFSGIRETSDGPHAELAITQAGEEIHWSRLGLASSRSREGVGRLLERGRPAGAGEQIPWMTMVERGARMVADAVRRGEPAQPLRPRRITGARYLVEPLLPLNQPTIVYSDGGHGKSTTALLVGVAVASGAPLPGGLAVSQPAVVMYADYESAEPVIAETVYFLEQGLGVSCGGRLLYKRLVRPLVAEAPALRAEVARHGVGLFILDSIGPAGAGEIEGSEAALGTMTALRSLGTLTTLNLAHVSKQSADQRTARVYGSVYYANEARSTWELRRAEDEPDDLVVMLYNRKANSSRLHPPIGFRFAYGPDAIRVSAAALADSPDLLARVTVRQRLRAMLATGALTAPELAEATGESEATIRKTLARMIKATEIVQLPGSPIRWGTRA